LGVGDSGVGGAQIPVIAERGALVETGANEVAVREVCGQRRGTDGDRVVVVRVAGRSVADLDLRLTGRGTGAERSPSNDAPKYEHWKKNALMSFHG